MKQLNIDRFTIRSAYADWIVGYVKGASSD